MSWNTSVTAVERRNTKFVLKGSNRFCLGQEVCDSSWMYRGEELLKIVLLKTETPRVTQV